MRPADCAWELVGGVLWRCQHCGRERLWAKAGSPPAINCPLAPAPDVPVWTPSEEFDAPGLARQAWNLAAAVAAFVADGGQVVSAEQYRARLAICDACEHRAGHRCGPCGCFVALKAKPRSQRCPIDKWPRV